VLPDNGDEILVCVWSGYPGSQRSSAETAAFPGLGKWVHIGGYSP